MGNFTNEMLKHSVLSCSHVDEQSYVLHYETHCTDSPINSQPSQFDYVNLEFY